LFPTYYFQVKSEIYVRSAFRDHAFGGIQHE
jgi:hypothetical protein